MPEPVPDDPARFAYQPALDGLRAVAVLAVFGYHAAVPHLAGGFLGVDAFFVISGFLITTLLVREWDRADSIRLTSFWARRVRRLFPGLALLLLAVAAYAVVLAPSVSRRSLRWDGLATLAYAANWRFVWSHQSYFEAAAGPSPLRHTWSLAVEEQWYLLWPPVLLVALTVVKRSAMVVLAVVTASLAVGSAVLMAALTPRFGDTSRAYFGTDTRAQGLLVGAALAFALQRWPLHRSRPHRIAAGVGVVGLAVGIWLFVTVDERTRWMYHGGFLLAAVAWAAVVTATLAPVAGPVQWLLSCRPAVALGRVSYGFYLWLWPAVVVLTPSRTHLHGWPLIGVQFVATIVVASASYVLVELPIRLGRWRSRSWWRPVPATTFAAAGVAAALVLATAGAPAPPVVSGVTTVSGGAVSKTTLVPVLVHDPPGLAAPAPGASSPPPERAGRPVSVAIVGDSVGFAMAWYAPPIAGVRLTTRAIPGCGVIPADLQIGDTHYPAPQRCVHWIDAWRAAESTHPDVALVVLGGWEVFDPWVDSKRLHVGTPEWRRYVTDQLERGVRALTAGTHTRVLLATVPCFRYDQPVQGIPSTERNDDARTTAVDAVVTGLAARHPGRVTLVDYRSYACPGGKPRVEVGGVTLRPDGMHTDARSTRVLWRWLAPIVVEAARRPRL